MAPENNLEQPMGQDDVLLADIWDALGKQDIVRPLDLDSLSITVRGGAVTLTGHLTKEFNRQMMDAIVQSLPGVIVVQNSLVVDHDLAIQVAWALATERRTSDFNLRVTASHGWICLHGEVPTHELQRVAEEVAGQVSSVRGVIKLPQVPGENPCPVRRPIQPPIGAMVYDVAGLAGTVTQVIVRPRNRLATHVAVRATNAIVAGRRAAGACYIVAAEAFERVDQDGVYLAPKGPPLNAHPIFNPDDYPLAPSAWKAPYPYKAGEVCWAFQPAP